jgi:hypothetical protein
MITTITTATIAQHVATEDELVLLGQVIDIDGREAVVLASTAAKNGSGRVIGEHLTITDEAWQFVAESLAQGAEAMTYTAHEDNAGGVHISNGRTAWFLGFDEYADLDGWAAGDWEPSENDGQTPETLDDYAKMADRTDSKRIK